MTNHRHVLLSFVTGHQRNSLASTFKLNSNDWFVSGVYMFVQSVPAESPRSAHQMIIVEPVSFSSENLTCVFDSLKIGDTLGQEIRTGC